MSLFYGGTAGAGMAQIVIERRVVQRSDCITLVLSEAAVSNFRADLAKLKRDMARALDRKLAAEDLRIQTASRRETAAPRIKGVMLASRRMFRLPRSGLPRAFSTYQGAF